MAGGVVFKQWYRSANLPATPVLNVKHLIYIATRRGVRENEGCGFGLWGRLPGMLTAKNLNNLKSAQRAIMDASKQNHTLYRAVLSVDKETAASYGLYDRETWQKLVTEHISVLAKEMNIEGGDFRWTASMHYAKSHPHVHIIYWDNSNKVRAEFIAPERFSIMAEHVRAEFGRAVFRAELQPLWDENREVSKTARLELQALCREANLEGLLNLNNVSDKKLDELAIAFRALALALPKSGALKYSYVSPKVPQLNAFIDKVMEISDFQKLKLRCEELARQESRFYGNGAATEQFGVERGKEKLYAELGNGVLAVLKTEMVKLQAQAPKEFAQLHDRVDAAARLLLPGNPEYLALIKLFPKVRMPIYEVLKDAEFQTAKRAAVRSICDDLRLRSQVRGYIDAKLKLPEYKEFGRKAFTKEVYRNLNRVVEGIVMDKLQEDAGWQAQYDKSLISNMLLRLFAHGGQGANQQQSRRDLLRGKKPELSKTARSDKHKQRESEGGWTLER